MSVCVCVMHATRSLRTCTHVSMCCTQRLFDEALREQCLREEVESVIVLPLFFGPSLAVKKKIPQVCDAFEVRTTWVCTGMKQPCEARALGWRERFG